MKSPHIKETLASGDLTLRQDLEGTGIGSFFSSVEAGAGLYAPPQGQDRHRARPVPEERSPAGV